MEAHSCLGCAPVSNIEWMSGCHTSEEDAKLGKKAALKTPTMVSALTGCRDEDVARLLATRQLALSLRNDFEQLV